MPRKTATAEQLIGLPATHAVLAQVGAWAFAELDMSVSLMDGKTWFPIHKLSDVIPFEFTHNVERERWAYNDRLIAQARRNTFPVFGKHAGFHDLFVPLANPGGPPGMIVAGPFQLGRPSHSDIAVRWRNLSGRHAGGSDPEFLHYASVTLGMVTFDRSELRAFVKLVSGLAALLQGDHDPVRQSREVDAMRERLQSVRFAERMWAATHEFVDERTTRHWLTAARNRELMLMGMKRRPQHALVGLTVSRKGDPDPLDTLIRRDAFVRACVALARKRGGVMCGRVGDYGVTLLLDHVGSALSTRAELMELATQARALALRFGFGLHVGIAPSSTTQPFIPHAYQAAL
ncbi:MAG TPA: hypothetical protein VGP93_14935, partial [Polyangiaceae bacterium]|nr:hypothetical protein [Polyangiaceae bacterium]